MAQVVVTINSRAFPLSCADGEEARIRRLAQYVDTKIGDFVRLHGQAGEARLLLLAALVIADELSDANEALRAERGRVRSDGGETPASVVTGILGMARRIESIAARLESA